MVEDNQRVGKHQCHVRETEGVGGRLSERLNGSHEVVAKETHSATREGRGVLHRRLVKARHMLGRKGIGVAAVLERPPDDGAGTKADEGPPPHALTLVGRLEQEGRLAGCKGAQLQKCRDRGLAILD